MASLPLFLLQNLDLTGLRAGPPPLSHSFLSLLDPPSLVWCIFEELCMKQAKKKEEDAEDVEEQTGSTLERIDLTKTQLASAEEGGDIQ